MLPQFRSVQCLLPPLKGFSCALGCLVAGIVGTGHSPRTWFRSWFVYVLAYGKSDREEGWRGVRKTTPEAAVVVE